MTDLEKLATQLEELNLNLKALIERLPSPAMGGWYVQHHHSYPISPTAQPLRGPGYWPHPGEYTTSGGR
jgi:hypothetical protein